MISYLFGWTIVLINVFARFFNLLGNPSGMEVEGSVKYRNKKKIKSKHKKCRSTRNSKANKLAARDVTASGNQEKFQDLSMTEKCKKSVKPVYVVSNKVASDEVLDASHSEEVNCNMQGARSKRQRSRVDSNSEFTNEEETLCPEEISYFMRSIRHKVCKFNIDHKRKVFHSEKVNRFVQETESRRIKSKANSEIVPASNQSSVSNIKSIDRSMQQADSLRLSRVVIKLPTVRVISVTDQIVGREKYKEQTKDFVESLSYFRDIHIEYILFLIDYIFYIEDERLLINPNIKSFILSITKHVDLCIFVVKISLIKHLLCIFNVSIPFNSFRYCASHFYDQKLIDFILYKILCNLQLYRADYKQVYHLLYVNLICLYTIHEYEMYTGDFYIQLLDMLYNFIEVSTLQKKTLVNFIRVSCVLYIGYMYNMLSCLFSSELESQEAQRFLFDNKNTAQLLRNMRKAVEHMYHPSSKNSIHQMCGLNIPYNVIQVCSKKIGEKIKKHINSDNMRFNVIVEDLGRYIALLLLDTNVRDVFEKDIGIYDQKIRTVGTAKYLELKNNLTGKIEPVTSRSL